MTWPLSHPTGRVALRGGGPSMVVELAELSRYAGQLRATSLALAGQLSPALLRLTADPGLLAAAVLDPIGAAEVARLAAGCLAMLAALIAECTTLAALLGAAERCYAEADQLDRRISPALRAVEQLPAALIVAACRRPGRGELQALAGADPELADLAVDALTAAATGPAGTLAPDASSRAAASVAALYRDGEPVLTARPDLARLATDDAAGPPRTTADLLRGLAIRSAADAGGGMIDVRTLDGPAGRRVIVDIAGTTDWDLDPRRSGQQASDFGTNLRSLANQSSVMERGVRQALIAAGVRADQPIMLVGHSQGGMVAARLASTLGQHGYRVTHLVSAGSPIGLAPVPDSVSVLALENAGDLVPQLDGADNPARPNWLTARLAGGGNSVTGRHAITTYQAAAQDLDQCDDPALTGWRAGAAGYLTARTVRTQVFQIRRA